MNLGTLTVKLKALTQQFESKMRGVERAIDKHSQGIATIGVAAGAAGVALGALGAKAVRTYATFESSMTRVKAVSGATEKQYEALSGKARELAGSTEWMANDVAQGMQYMAMAGADVNSILSGMPSVLELATAGAIDLGDAANIVTNVMAGFGKSTEELGEVNDMMVRAITRSNVDVRSLGEAFKYVGPVASSAGVKFSEVTAALGLLGNAGMAGSMSGTVLRGAISRLLNPTSSVANQLEKLGVNVKDSNGKLKSLTGIIRELEPHAGNTAAMMEIFGLRAGPGMMTLLNQGSEALEKFTTDLENSGGTAKRIAEQQLDTLSGKWKILNSQIESLAIDIGEHLEPALSWVIEKVQKVVEWFQNWSPEAKALASNIGLVTTGVTLAGAAVAGLILAGPKLKAALLLVRDAFVKTFIPFLPVIAAIAAAIAGVILFVGALRMAWEENLGGIRDKAEAVAKAFVQWWDGAIETVVDLWHRSMGWIQDKMVLIKAWLSDMSPDEAYEMLQADRKGRGKTDIDVTDRLASIGDSIGKEAKFAVQGFGKVWDKGKDTLMAPVRAIMDSFTSEIEEATGATKDEKKEKKEHSKATDKDTNAVKKHTGAVEKATEKVSVGYNKLIEGFGASMDSLSDMIDNISFGKPDPESKRGFGMGELAMDIQGPAMDAEQAVNETAGVLDQMGKQIEGAFIPKLGGFTEILSAAGQGFQSGGIIGAIIAVLAELLSRAPSFIEIVGTINGLLNIVVNQLETVLAPIAGVINALLNFVGMITSLFENLHMMGAGAHLLGKLLGWVADAINWVVDGISKVWNWIIDKLIDWFDWLGDDFVEALENNRLDDTATDLENSPSDSDTWAALGEALNGTTDAVDETAESFDELNDSMSNVPKGFKAALRTFQATSRDWGLTDRLVQNPGPGGNIIIQNMNVQAHDVNDFTRSMEDKADWDRKRSTGTGVETAPPHATGGYAWGT